MATRSVILLGLPVLLVAIVGSVGAAPQVTSIVCPAAVAVTAGAAQGWTTVSGASAKLTKATVDNSVGLSGPTLTCSYVIGTDAAHEVARLTRPEPAGALCTANPAKSDQFDCFPRPGANPPNASPHTQH